MPCHLCLNSAFLFQSNLWFLAIHTPYSSMTELLENFYWSPFSSSTCLSSAFSFFSLLLLLLSLWHRFLLFVSVFQNLYHALQALYVFDMASGFLISGTHEAHSYHRVFYLPFHPKLFLLTHLYMGPFISFTFLYKYHHNSIYNSTVPITLYLLALLTFS